jgi:hypothetical protein
MDIKRRTCHIRVWKKKEHLFLDISTTSITLVSSLYQCIETRNTEVFFTVVSSISALPLQSLLVFSEKFAT